MLKRLHLYKIYGTLLARLRINSSLNHKNLLIEFMLFEFVGYQSGFAGNKKKITIGNIRDRFYCWTEDDSRWNEIIFMIAADDKVATVFWGISSVVLHCLPDKLIDFVLLSVSLNWCNIVKG